MESKQNVLRTGVKRNCRSASPTSGSLCAGNALRGYNEPGAVLAIQSDEPIEIALMHGMHRLSFAFASIALILHCFQLFTDDARRATS